MKAHSLSVCIPSYKDDKPVCDKNCPYCVSHMTGHTPYNRSRWCNVIKKVLTLAKMACVTNVMMTGKGEPLLNYYGLVKAIQLFQEFPVELQTNGIWLNHNFPSIKELSKVGLDVVAVSLDQMENFDTFKNLFEVIKSNNLMLRICLNVISTKYILGSVEPIISYAINAGADQILFRRITIPKQMTSTDKALITRSWIVDNVDHELYNSLYTEFIGMIDQSKDLIRVMPHGAAVYDFQNKISVSFSDYCVQESNNTEDIRSLIFMEDGHIYTSWDKKSSILL